MDKNMLEFSLVVLSVLVCDWLPNFKAFRSKIFILISVRFSYRCIKETHFCKVVKKLVELISFMKFLSFLT